MGTEVLSRAATISLKPKLDGNGGLAWILDGGASSIKLLTWCFGLPSLREDEDIPIHVPHGCGWRQLMTQIIWRGGCESQFKAES